MFRDIDATKVGIVGLGYVGLPLAVAFGEKMHTIGFDVKKDRISDLKKYIDSSKEVSDTKIKSAKKLTFTDNLHDIAQANFYIVAVPTPVNEHKTPDLTPVIKASDALSTILKKGDVVVYESTVYPGTTEEICVPLLEKSGLVFNKDFFVGYSPERISPADKNDITNIVKVTSGSTKEIGSYIDAVYGTVITAGTFLAKSIRAAEACKVIENTQRDVNIAFMNEVSLVLHKMNIDTRDVLAAMKTKWNALGFTPGLVGGHCIGVDPYYLIHKAYAHGHSMDIARTARLVSDTIPDFIVEQLILTMCQKSILVKNSRILIMGASFKENCTDTRNARTFDIAHALKNYGAVVDFYDPVVNVEEVERVTGFTTLRDLPQKNHYDAIVVAVAHDCFKEMGAKKIMAFGKKTAVFFDIKNMFPEDDSDFHL